jgi:glycosyltransferase involved in cell wall biosynthesis
VTAICPTYNRKRFIPSAIDCFLSQTLLDSELLIVDDGTESVVDLIPENPRIRYVRLEGPRRTTGEKRNACCELAQGNIIVHWDDDDWSAPGRLENQVSQLWLSEKQVMVYYNILYWHENTSMLYRYYPKFGPRHAYTWEYANGASLCYHKSWWKQHRFGDIMVGEDSDFIKTAEVAGQMATSDACKFMVIRAHGNNTCSTAQWAGSPEIPLVSQNEIPPEFKGDQ